jgi:hypothetical protein
MLFGVLIAVQNGNSLFEFKLAIIPANIPDDTVSGPLL